MRILIPVLTSATFIASALEFGWSRNSYHHQASSLAAIDSAVPNDNRKPAGQFANNSLSLSIEARTVGWRPDLAVDSLATVMAFAETGKQASIPGPLLRVRAGTRVTVNVANKITNVPLVISGLRAGTVPGDTIQIVPGETRTITFTPSSPGTYLYWGAKAGTGLRQRMGRDAQLTGAIVIDPAGGPIDRSERIMVMTLVDIVPDTAKKVTEDVWETAINGRSWPHTERFTYNVGDTVRWRWVNGTDRPHPMHLHGFHFQVTAKGNGSTDSIYSDANVRLAVTEHALPGSTFAMKWVPARAGNWLMHCHMVPHITPYPERKEESRAHDVHDVRNHAEQAMAGLVIGITTVEPSRLAFWRKKATPLASEGPEATMRLFAQQAKGDTGKRFAKGYVLQRGAEPARDSVEVPGSTLLLTRGRTTRVTVINRLAQPTTIHWHGLELRSVYDGVSGWSGTGRQVAPLLAPGDSFTVVLTPPRAGTYMYHTHMDEESQLGSGMYGAIIVQEPGKEYDSARDLTFIHGQAVQDGEQKRAINGRANPAPVSLRAGQTYRFRIINLLPASPAVVSLVSGADTLTWRRVAKDGADLPSIQATDRRALEFVGVGEAYDYEFTPRAPMEAMLSFFLPFNKTITQQKVIVMPEPGR